LENKTVKLRREALSYIKDLKALENEILDALSKDTEQILNDEFLIEALSTSRKTAKTVAANLQDVNKTQNVILKARGIYTPAAYRAALLYFLVSDLAKVDPMYQFSLKWYVDIFTEEVRRKRSTEQDPLLDVIRNFTHALYSKVCQSIFEKDKMLFTFLLAFRILEGEGSLDKRLFEFFVKGPVIKKFKDEHLDSEDEEESEEQEEA